MQLLLIFSFWAFSQTLVRADIASENFRAKKNALLNSTDSFRSLGKLEYPAPTVEVLRSALGDGLVDFAHVRQLLTALNEEKRTFHVHEENEDPSTWDLSDPEKAFNQANYHTTHTYNLKNAPDHHLNLDMLSQTHVKASIRDIADAHIIHCQSSSFNDPTTLAVGSIILGTTRGAWATMPHVEKALASRLAHAKTLPSASRSFLLLRRVTGVTTTLGNTEGTCTKVATEDIHPWEMFSTFRVESVGEHPFETSVDGKSYKNNNNEQSNKDATIESAAPAAQETQTQTQTQGRNRVRAESVIAPDYPLVSCDQANFPVDDTFLPKRGQVGDFNWQVALYYGCIQYTKDFGSFNLNYNPSTKAATTAVLELGDGVHLSGPFDSGCRRRSFFMRVIP